MEQISATEGNQISLSEIITTLWRGKWVILPITIAAMAITALVSLSIEDEYRANALLAPNQSDSDLAGGLLAQFGGLASMAGISIGGGATDPTTVAVETLQSRAFLGSFIRKHNLKVAIFAATGWSSAQKNWLYDPEIYDEKSSTWVRKAKPPKKAEPSDVEAAEEFKKNFSVKHDKKTGLISVSLTSLSPEKAKEWLDWIVSDVNDYLREKDSAEARKSIQYLQQQLEQTSVAEMQKVFYQLIEQQTKTAMLAEVRQQYAFSIVDAPTVPEEKVWPKRALMVLFTGFFFGMVTCFVVLVRSRMSTLSGR